MKLWGFLAFHKLDKVVHTYDASTEVVEAEGSEVQGYSQLYSKFKASMGCMRPFLKKKKKKGKLEK